MYTAVWLLGGPRRGKIASPGALHALPTEYRLCAYKLSQVRNSRTPKCEWMQVTAVAITMTSMRSIPNQFKTFIGRQPWQHVTESPKIYSFFSIFLNLHSATKTSVCRRSKQNSGLVSEDLTHEEGESPAPNMKLTLTAIWRTSN